LVIFDRQNYQEF